MTNELERWLPLESAADFGQVVKLTPDGSPPANLAPWIEAIDRGLDAWQDGDYLVLVGDQALLAYAASVIGEEINASVGDLGNPAPVLRLLKWSRHKGGYEPIAMRASI